MKLNRFLYGFLIILFLASCKKTSVEQTQNNVPPIEVETPNDNGDGKKWNAAIIQSADWESTVISPAIVYKYYHFDNLFKAKESVTVFDINLNIKNIKVDIPYVETGKFIKTSEAGTSVNATAAINGSYFNTSTGGSHAFFRYQDKLVTEGTEDARKNAGFTISKDGAVGIIKKPTSGWSSTSNYTLLVGGPLLMFGGEKIRQLVNDFNDTRHPRTAIGVTSENHIIAVVVDGRFAESAGMTTTELSETMEALGCEYAMNYDGGGSSTAWLKNLGVVNYPSDNGKWDHQGERSVATVIAFIENN